MSGNVSDCSDDSFEIVSAETLEEPSSLITSVYKPSVMFHEMFDVYPVDTDIVARISFVEGYEKMPEDRVVILPVAWDSLDQGLSLVELQGNYVKFDVKDLPKTSADKFFQLCYASKDKTVKGVSAPFSFREVHEDELMEFQKEQNKEFWTFRSRFAILMNTYWNSLVECKKTIDVEEKNFVDTGVNPSHNPRIVENPQETALSDDEEAVSRKADCSGSRTSSISPSEFQELESGNTSPVDDVDQLSDTSEEYYDYEFRKIGRSVITTSQVPQPETKNTMDAVADTKTSSPSSSNVQTSQPEIENADNANAETKIDSSPASVIKNVQVSQHETENTDNADAETKSGSSSSSHNVRESLVKEDDVLNCNDAGETPEERKITLLRDYANLKSSNQALEAELKNTREFLDYMIEQKDERLKDMAVTEREGHVYVYETMKSQYRKRRENKGNTGVVQVEPSRFSEGGQSSATVSANNEAELPPEPVNSIHLIDLGYEDATHRNEHVILLRKLNAWFENESLDGFEQIRSELRMQYFHMERVNRHLSLDLHSLKEQYRDLESKFDWSRKELLRMEGRLNRKVNEKISLSKSLEIARQQNVALEKRLNAAGERIVQLTGMGHDRERTRSLEIVRRENIALEKRLKVAGERIAHLTGEERDREKNNPIIETFRKKMRDIQTNLEVSQEELTKEKEQNRALKALMSENEQNYAAQLVNLTFRNQKLTDEYNILKSDYELRLKQGAKEFARLSMKYQRLMKLSDHTYAVPSPSTSRESSTSNNRQ